MEQLTPDAMFVFIADVCLDSPAVQERLRRLFAGYSEMPPTAFVLFGNFLSPSAGSPGYAESLKVSAEILVRKRHEVGSSFSLACFYKFEVDLPTIF